MLFRRLILLSLAIGFIAGSILTLAQQIQSTDIILQSEQYEGEPSPVQDNHNHAHQHDESAWAPEDGAERLVYSFLANILTAIGYSAMLLAFMSYYQLQTQRLLNLGQGLLFGLFGYLTVFAAPSLGLSPEIPGTQAAALEARQLWWSGTVFATGIGFTLIFFKQSSYRTLFIGLGVLLLVLPHIIGAPHITGPEFLHSDPNVVATLTQLHQQFILAVSIVNFIFWIAIGLLCAWGLKRWMSNILLNIHSQPHLA